MRKRKKENKIKKFFRNLKSDINEKIDDILFELAKRKLIKPSMNFTTLNGRKAKVLTRIISNYMAENQSESYLCLDKKSNNTFIICRMPVDDWKDAFIPNYYEGDTAEV
jgi:hypothetical protein